MQESRYVLMFLTWIKNVFKSSAIYKIISDIMDKISKVYGESRFKKLLCGKGDIEDYSESSWFYKIIKTVLKPVFFVLKKAADFSEKSFFFETFRSFFRKSLIIDNVFDIPFVCFLIFVVPHDMWNNMYALLAAFVIFFMAAFKRAQSRDENIKVLKDERKPEYKCNCSKEKMKAVLKTVGKEELTKILEEGKKAEIVVDMLPRYTVESLEDFIECHFAMLSYRPVIDALIGVINKKLIPTVLKESKIEDLHMPCYELNWKEKKSLIDTLKEWKFTCIGTNDFNQAQVTVGGVNTKEINPTTLESNIVPNLYFCGEILRFFINILYK